MAMKLLIVGGGGREHALAWKASQSPNVEQVFVAPGNAGTAQESKISNVEIAADDIDSLLSFAADQNIALTIVGPEAPLVNGIVDRFQQSGLRIFGPSAAASQLEGSKTFAKEFLVRHQIPTATYKSFTELAPAIEYVKTQGAPIVVKADGLAAGKGVILAENETQAIDAIHDMLAGNSFGDAGHRVVIEEFLEGEEASFICMVDGCQVLPMASSQDHKALNDGDHGPNTGGMGAYSPAPLLTADIESRVMQHIIMPTVRAMSAENARYRGFLYAGLMIDRHGQAKVLEFNCRLGDPEAQPILMRLQSDLVELCIAACEGRLTRVDAQWDERNSLGVVLASKGYPGSYANNELIRHIPTETETAKVFHAGTRIDSDGNLRTNGGRVLCAVALGDGLAETQRLAYESINKIAWDTAYFRTDIGFKALR